MKVHISFERPSSFVLKLDDVQSEAWKKYQEAMSRSESFGVFDSSDEANAAFEDNVLAWDVFIDSISYELRNASVPRVNDVIDVSDLPWGAVNP